MGLRQMLDSVEHHFQEGGRLQKYYAIYEVFDTFLYAPNSVTRSTAHVRDGVDLKRIMITVWLAAFPAMFYGMYNLGFQAYEVMPEWQRMEGLEGWRGYLINMLSGYDPGSIWDCFWFGAVYFLPIYIVTFLVGISWEILFAIRRGHEVNEG
ncbi:MAG: RnfABCDGE type electron transport complex subunit D, partial [Halioglobus sp.]|nr:RnfABCDGE type electron transport complex subunit D [Halioglobus sp.]